MQKQNETITSWLSSAAIAALISGVITWHTNENEVSAKYVEMAVSILSSPDTKTETALREWSIKVINNYAISSLAIEGDLKNRLIDGKTNLSGFASDTVTASGAVMNMNGGTPTVNTLK